MLTILNIKQYINQYKIILTLFLILFLTIIIYHKGYKNGFNKSNLYYTSEINKLKDEYNLKVNKLNEENINIINEYKNKEKNIIVKYIETEKIVKDIVDNSDNMNCKLNELQIKTLNELTRNYNEKNN